MSLGNLYRAIEKIESGGDPNAISPKGARGLMQVMPSTAKNPGYGVRPARNQSKAEYVRVGKDYAKAMYNEFDGDIEAVLAAYNMGPGATKKWIERGRDKSKLPTETRKYIPKVQAELNKLNRGNFQMAKTDAIKGGAKVIKSASQRLKDIKAAKKKKLEESQLGPVVKDAKPKDIDTTLRDATIKKFKPKVDKKPIVKKKVVKKKVDAKTTPKVKKKVVKKKVDAKTTPKVKKKVDAKTNKQTQNVKPTAKKTDTKTNNKIMTTKNKIAVGTAIALPLAAAATRKNKKENVLSKKRNKDNRLPPGAFGGQVTSTAKPPKKIDPTAGNKIRKDRKIPKGALDASGDVKTIPKPSSPFGPIETKARNKFIKKSGGKDAFKSDKQIDSLFVNEMLDMREGSEGNSGFGLDDQNTYEKIIAERKSRKAGGKVSKKVGGKVVKRNMGGPAKPRKKVVFRRGGGKALRGFGKATYSNKMY